MRFSFFLSEAFGSMRRNWVMAMAAVITVFISTAILGAVLVTRDNLNQGATNLKNRVKIEVFIKDEATPEQTQALERKIQGLNDVKSYKYISKEEALRRFRERFGERSCAASASASASASSRTCPSTRCRRLTRSRSRTPTAWTASRSSSSTTPRWTTARARTTA